MTRRAWVLLLGFAALPACVQVLGLDEARLEKNASDGGPGSAGRRPPPPTATYRRECEEDPSAECNVCLQSKCAGDERACAQDTSCWGELDAYAECLGSECSADAEPCWMMIGRARLRNCAALCTEHCASQRLVAECELLCACMDTTCPGTLEDCRASCSEQPPEVARCHREHCFSGATTDDEVKRAQHCEHASGTLAGVCPSYSVQPEEDRWVCPAGQETGWGCNKGEDCCSGKCEDGLCM